MFITLGWFINLSIHPQFNSTIHVKYQNDIFFLNHTENIFPSQSVTQSKGKCARNNTRKKFNIYQAGFEKKFKANVFSRIEADLEVSYIPLQ